MDFGAYLKQIRTREKLSQIKLAMAIGLDNTYVSKVENGALAPFGPDSLMKVADVLNEPWENVFKKAGYCTCCFGTGRKKMSNPCDLLGLARAHVYDAQAANTVEEANKAANKAADVLNELAELLKLGVPKTPPKTELETQ